MYLGCNAGAKYVNSIVINIPISRRADAKRDDDVVYAASDVIF